MPHDGSPGALAFPAALPLIVPPFSVPSATPFSFSAPAQVALNEPLALVDVCSVTSHLKSVHVLGDGTMFDEDQLPTSDLMSLADGPVNVLFRSYPKQPAAAADTAQHHRSCILFMVVLFIVYRAHVARAQVPGSEKYTIRLSRNAAEV